jgi:uncharacterized membrane protein
MAVRIKPKAARKSVNTLLVISGVLVYLKYLYLIPLGIVGITAAVLLVYWYWHRRLADSNH